MKQTLFVLFLVISMNSVSAQNSDCKVLLDSLKGTYEGECSNGKASGKGKAVGVATYDGDFKNGLPDGKGKYTWPNGDFYYGSWKKGLKEGKGEIHRMVNGTESLITGFWKKDMYKGQYEEPYKIIEMNNVVTYKDVQKIDSKRNSLVVSMKSGARAEANVAVFQVANGTYQRTNFTEAARTKLVEFQDVQFPFRVRFTGVEGGPIDIEIYEAGQWKLEVVF